MLFVSCLKLFPFLRCLNVWLNKMAKVNFEIYDSTDWTTNDCNPHIAQYFK